MFPRLKDRVEAIVAEKFAIALIDRGVEQHMKHGFKSDCDCRWCIEKRVEIKNYMHLGPKMINYIKYGE